MHWVDRGPEPEGLADVRVRYTDRWVQYYDAVGSDDRAAPPRPNLGRYRERLSERFYGLCAYCEERSEGEIDHFRPRSGFPELVYEWSNWLFCCSACNRAKGDKWPDDGYVDPCADAVEQRPEAYFDFDTITGQLIPRSDLNARRKAIAERMIEDLKLNSMRHLQERADWIALLQVAFPDGQDNELYRAADFCSRDSEVSSVKRAWLAERGRVFDDGGSSPPS